MTLVPVDTKNDQPRQGRQEAADVVEAGSRMTRNGPYPCCDHCDQNPVDMGSHARPCYDSECPGAVASA